MNFGKLWTLRLLSVVLICSLVILRPPVRVHAQRTQTFTLDPDGDGAWPGWTPYPSNYAPWQCVSSLSQEEPDMNTVVRAWLVIMEPYWGTYSFNNPVPEGSQIEYVRIYARARHTLAGYDDWMLNYCVYIGGALWSIGGWNPTLTLEWETKSSVKMYEPPPWPRPWRWDDIDALDAGIKGWHQTGSNDDEALVTHVYVEVAVTTEEPVGGFWVPVDKLGLLAPYIGFASTIVVATAATAFYVKRVKRRKEK